MTARRAIIDKLRNVEYTMEDSAPVLCYEERELLISDLERCEREESKSVASQEGNKSPVTTAQVRSESPANAAAYCQKCEQVQPTIDDGETCAVCKLVLPGQKYDIPSFLRKHND